MDLSHFEQRDARTRKVYEGIQGQQLQQRDDRSSTPAQVRRCREVARAVRMSWADGGPVSLGDVVEFTHLRGGVLRNALHDLADSGLLDFDGFIVTRFDVLRYEAIEHYTATGRRFETIEDGEQGAETWTEVLSGPADAEGATF